MEIIRKESQHTANWSGGQTTEIYIYPKGSDYKLRDFKFRLSTATVEIPASEFTPLSGVNRTLMVLEGKMELIHEGHHSVVLSPLEKDCFQGGWNTRSVGECIDFNLMCREGANGDLNGMKLLKGQLFEFDYAYALNYLYLYDGKLEIGDTLNSGDFVILNSNDPIGQVKALEDSIVVLIGVDLLK